MYQVIRETRVIVLLTFDYVIFSHSLLNVFTVISIQFDFSLRL